MAALYILASLVVLVINAGAIPHALGLSTHGRPLPVVLPVLRSGRRSALVWHAVFSNEAGLGSALIAHAAAKTKAREPGPRRHARHLYRHHHRLSFTALAILSTGLDKRRDRCGADLGSFRGNLPGLGGPIIAPSLAIFAFTTIIGWSYYSERLQSVRQASSCRSAQSGRWR